MALPNVEIIQLNDQLGTIAPSEDGVAGLIVLNSTTGVPVDDDSNEILDQAFLLRSLADATALGITTTSYAYRHIADFYRIAPRSSKLYVTFIKQQEDTSSPPQSVAATFAGVLSQPDKASLFLDQAQGEIKILAVVDEAEALKVDVQSTPTPETTDDLLPFEIAIPAADALRTSQENMFRYISVVLEGKLADSTTAIADLPDLRGTYNANRVSVVVGAEPEFVDADSTVFANGYASVGLVLGRLAAIPVQRNIGRVKDGPIVTVNAGFANGDSLSDYRATELDTLHEKGYIFFRKHVGFNGFYFNDDPTAVDITDDYAGISAGRTVDKASRIARRVYTNELLDDIDLNDDGTMRPSVIAYFQSVLQNAISVEMAGEISSVIVFADPTQQVASTSQIKISMSITRRGQAKSIQVTIGFTVSGL